MIEFGVLSISLLVGTAQGLVLALMLWRVATNRAANRWLALLIVAVAALIGWPFCSARDSWDSEGT